MSTAFTLRVSCIPSSVNEPQFISIFDNFIKKNSPPEEGKVGKTIIGSSFAPAATSADSEACRTATITVRRVPEVIREVIKSGNELELEADGESLLVFIDTEFIGLTPLNVPKEDPTVDIIAVTGLAGHAFGSWKARGGTTMWLRDLLPTNLPSARILTYGYDSKLLDNESNSSILDFAKRFLEAVKSARMGEGELHRPIIFIGYSLGGLVIKQALVDASRGSESDKLILCCSYGLLLFGVPNRGLQVEALRSMVKGQPNGRLIEDLDPESRTLRMLHDNFAISFNFVDSEIISIYETKRTRAVVMKDGVWKREGELIQMVAQDSATWFGPNEKKYDQLPIDTDHSNIPKFQNRSSADYITIRQKLIGMVEKGPAVITKRFGLSPELRQSIETLLCPVDFKKDTASWSHDRCEGTGDWLLSDPVFESWRDMKSSKVLWLKGGPGSGKTYLISRVLERIQAHHGKYVAVAFFFCDNKTQNLEKRAMPSITKTLLSQLLFQIPPQYRVDLEICVQHISNYPADNQVTQLFKDTFRIIGRHLPKVFLIIDALDECEEGDLCDLIAFLDGLRSIQTTAFQIILSGRSSIEESISCSPLAVHVIAVTPEGVRQDITTFVSSKVREFRIGEPEDEGVSTQKITERCETFLLARLHLTSLKYLHIKTQKTLEEALSGLPKDISRFYKQIFGRQKNFDPWQRRIVRKIFMWVIYAKRPLRLIELAEAVSEENLNGARSYLTERDLDDYCGGLVVLKAQDDCCSTSEAPVELLHRTVKDFVIGFEWEMPQASILKNSNQCISEIFYTSVTYMYNLKVEQVDTGDDGLDDKHPFLEYVYGFWILNLLDLDSASPSILDTLVGFLGSESCYAWWDSPLSATLNGTREARRSLRLRFHSWVTTFTKENPKLGQHVDFMTAQQKRQVVRYTDLKGESHPETLDRMDSLGDTYLDEGRWGEARLLYEKSLAICKEKNDLRSLAASSNLAKVFTSQGRWRDASTLQQHVMETYRVNYGESSPESIAAAAELGRTYNCRSFFKEAEKLQEYVVRISRENNRENHPDYFRAIRDLARTYKDQERWGEAERLLKDALSSSRKVFGDNHVETLAAMRDLARGYAFQGRPDDAEVLQLEVVAGYDKAFGKDHAESLIARFDLSFIYLMQRQIKDAVRLAELVLDTRRRVLGKDHYLTVYSKWYLGYTLVFKGSWIRAAGKFIDFAINQTRIYADNVTLATLGLGVLPTVTWRMVEIGGRSFPIPDNFSYRALEFDGWNILGEPPMVTCTMLGKYQVADTLGFVDREEGFHGWTHHVKRKLGSRRSGSS